MCHGDQDVPAGTSDTDVVASAVGLPEGTPPSALSRRGMGDWGMFCTTPAAPRTPLQS